MERLVSASEFARLLDVSRNAVQKARQDQRLSKSFIEKDGKVFFDIVEGIKEWFGNVDPSKDQGNYIVDPEYRSDEDLKTPKESTAMKLHYSALNEKVGLPNRRKKGSAYLQTQRRRFQYHKDTKG